MPRIIIATLLAMAGCKAGVRLDPKTPYDVLETRVDVPLEGDLSTQAAIVFPAVGKGPHPVVVLVHDSGPLDMNGTIDTPVGTTRPLLRLSRELAARGFAVVRFHKRHVTGDKEFDLPAFIADEGAATSKRDVERVLDAIEGHVRIDAERVFLHGVGEGTTVVAAVAADRPTLAGVVLQGPVAMPWPELMKGWFELAGPYLQRFGPVGFLDGRRLGLALRSAASRPVLDAAEMVAVSYTRGAPAAKVSPFVDKNRDGLLDLAQEFEPRIDDLIGLGFGPIGGYRVLTGERSLPPVTEQLDGLGSTPILVLQGERDARTPPKNAEILRVALKDRSHPDFSVVELEGLGHSLGRAKDPIDDLDRPMADAAIDVLTEWLVAHVK